MTEMIARSRIGFWSAFVHEGRAILNARRPDTLEPVTIMLDQDEALILAGHADDAHAFARALAADVGRHANHLVPTPGIQSYEPVVHEWTRTAIVEPIRRLAA
jgi:hypothetical protein